MLAECGKLSLTDVLAPAIQMADGYPIEAQLANAIERQKERLKQWPYSKAVFLPHPGEAREAPRAGRGLQAAGPRGHAAQAGGGRAAGAGRRARAARRRILAAYDRFYKGDIAQELVRGHAGAGRAHHARGPRALEVRTSRSR